MLLSRAALYSASLGTALTGVSVVASIPLGSSPALVELLLLSTL